MEGSGCIMGCQPIIISPVFFNKLKWAGDKHPLTNFRDINFRKLLKHVARPAQLQKNKNPLAFLLAA
jgi:hypothetical protein